METSSIRCGELDLFFRFAGDQSRPALILLHGWPHDSSLYDQVIDLLGGRFFAIAFDLPAVGRSSGSPRSGEKATLAGIILDAAEAIGARQPVIAGIDVGGMIAFSAAREFASRLRGAAIGNTVIPGIDPWRKVVTDPRIFHFALHAVPDLPEALVTGRERRYFDFFFDFLGSRQRPLSEEARGAFTRAYQHPAALTAGFDWYRAFPADAKRNAVPKQIDTPMLYFRGDADGRTPDEYAKGLHEIGANRLRTHVLTGGAEFAPLEMPDAFANMIETFATKCVESVPA
jgi:pimeloyl-ACP methyl ester carboxylesterase